MKPFPVVQSTLSRDVQSTLSRDVQSTLSRDVQSTLSRDVQSTLSRDARPAFVRTSPNNRRGVWGGWHIPPSLSLPDESA
jgi:hypothetical protein